MHYTLMHKEIPVVDIEPVSYTHLLCGVGYNSTQHKDIYNTLFLYSEEIGVPVSEEDFEGIGTRGAYNPRNKHIHICLLYTSFKGGIQKGVAELMHVSDRQVRTYRTMSEQLTAVSYTHLPQNAPGSSRACQSCR